MKILAPFRFSIEIAVRDYFGLSNDYYAVAKIVEFICNDPKNKERAATGDYRKVVAEAVGISEETVKRAIKELTDKNIIANISRQKIKTTEFWYSKHANPTEYNSGQNEPSEENTKNLTQVKMTFHSGQNEPSVYIYTNNTIKHMSNLPVLTYFKTSFLDGFFVLMFESSEALFTALPKNSQKGGGGAPKNKKSAKSVAGAACDALFAEFWAAYPRKEKKVEAGRRYRKLAGKHRDVMAALVVYTAKVENTDAQYIKLPTTFLTDYEDYLPSDGDLFASTKTPTNSQKGGGDDNESKELEKIKTTIKTLAKAIADKYGSDEASKKERLSGSAFGLTTATGERIFDDTAAATVEEMGGTYNAVLECAGENFDARVEAAYHAVKHKVA